LPRTWSPATPLAQSNKSKGLAPPLSARETAAATHGALRHLSGFDLNQLGAEYRALRASVIRLWTVKHHREMDSAVLEDMIRFNEAVDQAVAESTSRYAAELALSRDTFMAILAHDLRSPLSAIAMLGYLLERSAATEAARKQSRQIQSSAKEMGAMIRDLLEYTRTQLGKGIPVHTTKCSIAEICRQALDEVRAGHPQRQFEFAMREDVDWLVDNARLRQALSNLLNNAVQHGEPATPITLSAAVEDGHQLTIRVKNEGKPIPPESLQVIFDPLVQLSKKSASSDDRTSTSLGLGLFIAREIATGHGGTLEVSSDAANGTVFVLRIPQTHAP
jgi:signal transduction histidine kinase